MVERHGVRDGDLLLVRAIGSLDHLGKCFVAYPGRQKWAFDSHLMRLRFDQIRVHPEFVYHFLTSPVGQHEFLKHSRRSAVQFNINTKELARIRMPLPPLEQQTRIVAILGKAEAMRRKREDAVRLTEELLRSIFLEMFGDPIRNERNWSIVKVSDAGGVQLGRQRAPQFQTGKFTRPYLRVANVFEDRIDLTDILSMDFNESDFATFRLKHSDILLNEGQSTELVGRPAMWRDDRPDCCFQNTLVRFRADPRRTEPEFALEVFLFYLRKGQFARISSKTSNVAHLGAGRFAEMPFPLPPLKLQQVYATKRRAAHSLLERRRQQLERSAELTAALVQRAFRGDL